MIYLESTTEIQTIMVPNVYGYDAAGDAVRLVLLSTVDLAEFASQTATSGGSYSQSSFSAAFRIGEAGTVTTTTDGRYVIFSASFGVAPVTGSWEYRLLQGTKVIGSGCAQVGEYAPDIKSYDKPIQYEQY